MNNTCTEFEELDDIIQEGREYAENCWRAQEDGWFYPDDNDASDNGATD